MTSIGTNAKRRLALAALALGAILAGFVRPTRVLADPPPSQTASGATPQLRLPSLAGRANERILALDFDGARALLAGADPNDPLVVLTKARLALYEEDCDLAASLMSRPNVPQDDEARLVTEVARGCARVTAATLRIDDAEHGIVFRFQNDEDRALVPLLADTVVKARASLARDLGVTWTAPTRITVVRDLLSLSAMTGLPYKSAQTTGTVAVAKWGRVTILSPRASRHGFPFRDTLTHELTHLAIAMQTLDRAPLWLHEGVARREETRWREPGIFDDRPSPESVVLRGIEMKLDLPLDKLGPSIAMLPGAEAATVAFAEVTSFVRFFVRSMGPDVLPKLLVALREAKTVDAALQEVSGQTLAQWDTRWRAELAAIPKEPLSPLLGLGHAPPGLRDTRERVRLAELLFGREHPHEARASLDKIAPELLAEPSLRYIRARVLEADDDVPAAAALVERPEDWIASFGPCWSMRARLAHGRGDAPVAESATAEALAHDPLAVETACGVLPKDAAGAVVDDPVRRALCEAARARGEPDIGGD